MSLSILPMRECDLDSVVQIEKKVAPYGWNLAIFSQTLQSNGYDCSVLFQQGTVIGYYVLAFIVDETHIINIAVTPKKQGRGYGDFLMQSILQKARTNNSNIILLEVRESNSTAIALYNKYQFHSVGERRNYYDCDSGRENAIIMRRDEATITDFG